MTPAATIRLQECFRHTDLEWRLAQIPAEASCRGAFINMLDERAGQLGRVTQTAYREAFSIHKVSPFKMIPVSRYVTQLVVLAQIHHGNEAIHQGMRAITGEAFSLTSVLFGRSQVPDKARLAGALWFVERTWSRILNYSKFSFTQTSSTQIVVSFTNEYVYIDPAMLGGLEGLARLCGVDVRCSVKLRDAFNGEIVMNVV
jgi:hypothetical protein